MVIDKALLGHRLTTNAKFGVGAGFTLVELLITISIAAILLAIAIPNFTSTIVSNRLTTNANEFVSALNLARSEAINRETQVSVRRAGSTSGQWEDGWNVFVDLNGNGALNDDGDTTLCEAAEDCLLRAYATLPTGFTLRVGATTVFKDFIAFLPSGLSSASPSTADFKLCSNSGTKQKAITIAPTGRPSVGSETTGTCP